MNNAAEDDDKKLSSVIAAAAEASRYATEVLLAVTISEQAVIQQTANVNPNMLRTALKEKLDGLMGVMLNEAMDAYIKKHSEVVVELQKMLDANKKEMP